MDFGKVLTNPIVLGGGVLIGLFLLAGKSTPAQSNDEAVITYNLAALQAYTQGAGIMADVAKERYNRDAYSQAQFVDYLKNNSDNRTILQTQFAETQGSVVQKSIESSMLISMDTMQNANRLGLAQIAGDVERARVNGEVASAKAAAKAAEKSAVWGAVGDIAGSIASIF